MRGTYRQILSTLVFLGALTEENSSTPIEKIDAFSKRKKRHLTSYSMKSRGLPSVALKLVKSFHVKQERFYYFENRLDGEDISA